MSYNIAGANEHKDAGALRDDLECDMTRAEIRRATERACLHGLGLSGLPAVISCWTGVEVEMLTESGAGLRSGTRSTPQRRGHG